MLSDGAASVSSSGTLAPATQLGYYPSEIVLRQGATATEAWFFQQTENPGYPHLFRSLLFDDGRITTSEFPLADMPTGELSIASTDSRTVAVVARAAVPFETDLVAFAASSTDALHGSTGFPVTLAAPVQSEARTVRRGEETLVTWVERTGDSPGGKVRATLLDRDGRPREAPPIDLFPTAAYAIATDGVEYLVAKDSLGKIRVRRLRSDLTWRDPDWTTVVSSGCNLLRDDAVAWDGNGWWIGWSSCGEGGDPIVQRLDRDLQPLTSPVAIESEEAPSEVRIVPLGGAIVVLWLGDVPPCQICTCAPPLMSLFGARVSTEGVVLTPSTRIVEDVEYASLDIASNGSEILAMWTGGFLSGTRIRSDLSTPDVTTDQYGRHGAVLEEKYSDTLDIAWDGEAWVAVSNALAYDGTYHRTFTFRRFVTSGDLAAAWNGADQRQLDTSVRSGRATVSAAPGGPTILLHELANESTTGVLRYFLRNLTDAPRSRGVRR
ncbi:MAG: hypothetical protein NDJ92_11375, partial [Thermoanaerobaculia bacterium]|nr:hypothetical protein [Thermoanaerobaculia bacterium]